MSAYGEKICEKGYYCPGIPVSTGTNELTVSGGSVVEGGLIKCPSSTWDSSTGLLTQDTTNSYYIWDPTTIVDGTRINSSYKDCKIPAGEYCGYNATNYAFSDMCETDCCAYHSSSSWTSKCVPKGDNNNSKLNSNWSCARRSS
jgi:hypothetical protein